MRAERQGDLVRSFSSLDSKMVGKESSLSSSMSKWGLRRRRASFGLSGLPSRRKGVTLSPCRIVWAFEA